MIIPKKTFRVVLSETNCYTIDIRALDEDAARNKALDRYWQFGPEAGKGFQLYYDDGGIEAVSAEEVVS